MQFKAEIDVMPLKELLDPQGKAVLLGLKNLNIPEITEVRIGKHITTVITANSEAEAKEKAETCCKKLLANPVMEYYDYTISELK